MSAKVDDFLAKNKINLLTIAKDFLYFTQVVKFCPIWSHCSTNCKMDDYDEMTDKLGRSFNLA